MTTPTFEPPAEERVVARLRMPLRVTGLVKLSEALEIFYGKGLYMLMVPGEDWVTVILPEEGS